MVKRTRRPATTIDVSAAIRAAGLRRTSPRVAVLARLQAASTPQSHGEIVTALASHGWDRATIYRNLMDLVQAGLLTRIDLGDHVWRFEARRTEPTRGPVHPHFVCNGCGTVSCLPQRSVRMNARATPKPRVVGQVSEVLLKGTCRACA